jgi:hypothetical protein
MPLLAAAVGVLGGVGGAYIGGVVANEGQEQQSESERAAAIQDLRIDVYGDYLGAAEALVAEATVGSPKAQREAYVKLFPVGARVYLVAETPEVAGAAQAVADAITAEDSTKDDYDKAARNFLAVARDEIAETGG